MVEIKPEIIQLIKRFLKELDNSNINIKKAILFGSYAKGKEDEWSDIDIALVSEDFTGNRFDDNEMIRKAKFAVSYDIEPLTFLPNEFDETNPFIREILYYGVPIS